MPRKKADDQDEIEYNDMVIPRTIGEPVDDEDYDDLELGDDDLDDDDDPRDHDDARYQALEQQMGSLKAMMEQQGNFYQSAFATLMANGRGSDQAAAAEDAGAFTLDDLPDPVEDRAGFNKALQSKVSNFVKSQTDQTAANAQVAGLENTLTTNFYRDYPDLAKKGTLFRAAVTEEANILKTSGINAASSIAANPDAFLAKVANRMNTELGIDPDSDDDNADDEGEPRRKPRKQARSGGNRSRSRNLGSPSRPKGRGGRKRGDPPKPKGFLAELRQQQSDFGLI